MGAVATLHVRNVPVDVYEVLQRRAKRLGRSLNAEVIAILQGSVDREREHGSITERLEQLARKINLPPDAPRPEDLIREDRDTR